MKSFGQGFKTLYDTRMGLSCGMSEGLEPDFGELKSFSSSDRALVRQAD